MDESGHSSVCRSSLRTSDLSVLRSHDPFRKPDVFTPSFTLRRSSSTGEYDLSPRSLFQFKGKEIVDTTTTPPPEDERQRSNVQDIYKFYETLSEKAYDLSMTDLVIRKPLCTNEGLPIEDNRGKTTSKENFLHRSLVDEQKAASTERRSSSWFSIARKIYRCPSPDTSRRNDSSVVFPSYLQKELNSTSSSGSKTSPIKASATDVYRDISRPLSSKSHRTQSTMTSPKVSPMHSPRSSSASAMSPTSVSFKSLDITVPRNTVPANARQKNPGVRMDANNQCSVCSSYTQFFKARCQVCGKLYCSNCMQEEVINTPDGVKCKKFCAERLSKRSCWPFGFRRGELNEV